MIPTNMDCYSCHSSHGAVDTTFVQFYPTLLDIAKQKGTLSSAYQKEDARASRQKPSCRGQALAELIHDHSIGSPT